MPEPPKENVADVFAKVIEDWRRRHQLREDEPLLLCLELFRIHQEHWDELRRKELPAYSDLAETLRQFQQETDAVQRHTLGLTEELRKHPASAHLISPTIGGLLLTALFAIVTGVLIGKFIL